MLITGSGFGFLIPRYAMFMFVCLWTAKVDKPIPKLGQCRVACWREAKQLDDFEKSTSGIPEFRFVGFWVTSRLQAQTAS